MDKSDVEKLLNQVSEINAKYDLVARETGNRFNIFDVMNVSHKEVYMCRVLSEILNPTGCHSQGNLYLELFFETLKKNHCNQFNLDTPTNAIILREESIDECRRIDITIDDFEHKQYLPIEVKIYANDQKNQCEDYLKKAKEKYNQGNKARLCYLTIGGKMPNESSINNLSSEERDQIITISWEKDIVEWLNSCICHTDTIRKAPILEILLQFKSAIEEFTNIRKDKRMTEILKLLKANENYWHTAQEIANNINKAKDESWKKLTNKIKTKINSQRLFIDDDCRLAYEISSKDNKTTCAVLLHRNQKEGLLLLTAVYNSTTEKYIDEIEDTRKSLKNIIDEYGGDSDFDSIVDDAVNYIKEKTNYATK